MKPVKDRPYLLLIMAVLFWAGNFILGRAFHTEIPPVALAFWRWVGAALLVTWPALPHLRRDRQDLLDASMMPVLIGLFSFLIFRGKVTRLQSLGILVSLCGAVLIIAQGDLQRLQSLSFNRGDLLVFTAIACYAGYSVMLRKRPPAHPLAFIATTFWLGSFFLIPLYLWETLTVASIRLNLSTLLVLAYVMVFPSIVSYLCFNRGVELVGANRAGLFIHLMPVFGGLMAVVFLGEVFGWYHGIGIVMIGLGIYLATRKNTEAVAR